MKHQHDSVSPSRHWRQWIPATTAAGAGGTALVVWFEELITFATEFIGVIFLPILAGILYLFNHYVFKSAMPKRTSMKKNRDTVGVENDATT